MLTEERLQKIVALVDHLGSVSVQNLVTSLDASEATIRRDLNALHKEQKLIKVRGGAVSIHGKYSTKDEAVAKRKARNRDEKLVIAQYAASLIQDDDFVFLDAGTTTELMIDFISCQHARFVTNAISHAKKLSQKGFTTYILGGEYKNDTEAIVGEEAVLSISKYNFTKGFWGTNGASPRTGLTTPDVKEAAIKQQSMRNCKERYVLCDSTKFEAVSSVRFAAFSDAVILTTRATKELEHYKNVVEVEKQI